MNSLNPVMRVEPQMWDGIIAHEGHLDRAELKRRSDAALESVGLPLHTADLYPHELSGGMKQRVCIAMGIILNPELIIADEPTSALDVVTQRQVMQTLKAIQTDIGSGLMLIGHDMGLMAQTVDELAVKQLINGARYLVPCPFGFSGVSIGKGSIRIASAFTVAISFNHDRTSRVADRQEPG